MKIALVSPYDYAGPGGVNNHISHLADQFVRMGHQVKVLAPCSARKAELDKDNIAVGRVIAIPHNGSIAAITLSWWAMPRVKAILAEETFDIVHLHEPICPLLPWMVLSLSDSVNIGSFHAYYERSFWYRIGGWTIARMLVRKLHGRVAVSEAARECINRYLPNDYRLIPNGIDVERFSNSASPITEFCDGKLNILFVGRLEERKGIVYLLRAYEQVKREYPRSRLIVVGPGGSAFKREVAKKGIKDVVFVGYVPQTDLPRYYHTADIFCAPSVGKESFGIILLEAMAAGKPIIASDITGYSQLVTAGEEALLVPPKDAGALAQALGFLLGDAALRQRMGAAGKRKVERYSWKNIAQQTMDYYLEVLATERGKLQ